MLGTIHFTGSIQQESIITQNEQGTRYEYSISIELKNGPVNRKSIQKLVNVPNFSVIGLNSKEWYTFKNR